MPFTENGLRSLSQRLHEPAWLLNERLKSWHTLQKILANPAIKKKPVLPETLAPPTFAIKKQNGLRVETLHALLTTEKSDWAKTIFLERRSFPKSDWAFHFLSAFFVECSFFVVEETTAELELESSGGPAFHFIHVPKGASLTYTHRVSGAGFQAYELHAEEGASVSRLLVHTVPDAGFLANTFCLGPRAKLEHFSLATGAGILETDSRLEGEAAESHDVGIFSENNSKQFAFHSWLQQLGRDTRGDILVKGIAQDTAHANLDGMIRIGPDGENAQSFLAQHVLLLNPGARADTNPQLEIENNNVQSSHSASTGQLDENKLFYLTARGIPPAQARRLLVAGFLDSAIRRVQNPTHRRALEQLMEAKPIY